MLYSNAVVHSYPHPYTAMSFAIVACYMMTLMWYFHTLLPSRRYASVILAIHIHRRQGVMAYEIDADSCNPHCKLLSKKARMDCRSLLNH